MASKGPLTPLEEFWENIIFRDKYNYSPHIFLLKWKGLIASHRQQRARGAKWKCTKWEQVTTPWKLGPGYLIMQLCTPQDHVSSRTKTQYPTNPNPIPGFESHLITRVILSLPHLQYCSCHLLGFGQLLQFSTVSGAKTHTKLRTGTLAVWRKTHSSCIDPGRTCMSFCALINATPEQVFLLYMNRFKTTCNCLLKRQPPPLPLLGVSSFPCCPSGISPPGQVQSCTMMLLSPLNCPQVTDGIWR